MDEFNKREKAYEDKFIHDAEIDFKITSYAHKKLALWAAEKMHMDEIEAKSYAQNIMDKNIDQKNDQYQLVQQLLSDFLSKDLRIDETEINNEYHNLEKIAYDKFMKK